MKPYIIPIFIPFQGCPFHCVYCQQEDITATPAQLPSIDQILKKIQTYLATRRPDKYSHVEVAFYGGTFTGLPSQDIQNMLSAVRPYLERGQVNQVRASTKPDYISPEILDFISPYGLNTIELGVQSFDDDVLKQVGRGYISAQVTSAVQILRNSGFKVGLQLMPGLPGADEAEALLSVEKAIQLQPDFVRIYPTIVLKNTALARLYQRGLYQPWSLEQAIQICRKIQSKFNAANIPIIKMGLEFSSNEREGILAGPYHPNFRQLL